MKWDLAKKSYIRKLNMHDANINSLLSDVFMNCLEADKCKLVGFMKGNKVMNSRVKISHSVSFLLQSHSVFNAIEHDWNWEVNFYHPLYSTWWNMAFP